MDRDFSRSRAILIGNGVYRPDSKLSDIPAASTCVRAMGKLLTGELCGWPENRITQLVDVKTPQELAREIRKAVNDVQDMLLLYYVGHGIRTRNGKLALTVADTDADPDLAQISGILYENIAEILRCGATAKLVILDCCMAELGTKANYAFQSVDLAEEYPVEGLYFIGASKRYENARFSRDGTLTYFTAALLDTVRDGIPGQAPMLRLDQIFVELRRRLVQSNLPEPVESGIRGTHQYHFARNAAYKPAPMQHDDLPGTRSPIRHPQWALQARRQRAIAAFESAVRSAQTISEEFTRAVTLIEIARAWAPSNPPRAVRLFSDAERFAKQIKPANAKAFTLGYLAKARALGGFGQNAEPGGGHDDDFWCVEAMTGTLEALASGKARRAERLARSFTGTTPEARAVAVISVSLVLTDLRRSERLARTITQERLRAWALAECAKTMTGSDNDGRDQLPAHFERLAETITDEGAKVLALGGIAAAAAPHAPDRAERLFADAERLAESIDTPFLKAGALVDLAKALALSDPDRAERLADRVGWETGSDWVRIEVARVLASADPDRAERLATTLKAEHPGTDPGNMTVFLNALTTGARVQSGSIGIYGSAQSSAALAAVEIARALAPSDPDRAERFARAIAFQAARACALAAVALVLAPHEPDRAERLFADAESLACTLSDGGSKAVTLAQIAKALAADSIV